MRKEKEERTKEKQKAREERPFWAEDRCPYCLSLIDNSEKYQTGCPCCHRSFLD